MAQQVSEDGHGGFPGEAAENRLADDWPVYVALLPGVVIGIIAAIVFATASSSREHGSPSAASVKSIPADADDYVQGLARLGIAKIPGYEPPPLVASGPRGGAAPLTQLTRACVRLG